ncbi:NADP-dependent oxidoreductase [Pseudomonas sp. GX19020]|uniref:NADP-dependent oxidoreductase n=1 Tax=Pseudomonas sp. GX19020 TaxID=2942277 RepID=UPI0020193692|nr:NADP-dependent oxidoreductase [Pseudomonas sp. GX19020]MCL4068342.1 NADP-dependent oxidoreductase [Pseudomonas sp. GX19020]
MRAALITTYGSNDVVELVEIERPVTQPDEVLVKVSAAGINPIDWKSRSGAGQRMGMMLPIRLGSEFVGVIEEVGASVAAFKHGDEVFGMVKSGGFAQYLTVKATDIACKPKKLDTVRAAALPLAGTTAWQALFGEAGLVEGQRLLITGASGGVGSLAVQFAKAKGVHVTALTSPRNMAFVRSLGPDMVIDYTAQPFEESIRDIDVVFDTVGADTFQRAFKTLRRGGIMVTVVAFPEGHEAAQYGVEVKRSFTVPNAATLVAIQALVDAGQVTPHVETILPLSEIKRALALSEAGRVRGKVVVIIT